MYIVLVPWYTRTTCNGHMRVRGPGPGGALPACVNCFAVDRTQRQDNVQRSHGGSVGALVRHSYAVDRICL